jgi:two-component system NtrC family sensor kinase
MKPLIKTLFLIIIFLFVVSIQTTPAQDSHYNYNYDSLALQLNKPQTDAERVKLLMFLVDIAPKHTDAPPEKTLEYLVQLIHYNGSIKLIDSAPYEFMLEGYSIWRKSEYGKALTSLKNAVVLFDRQKKIIVTLLIEIRLLFNRLHLQEERYKFYKEKLDYYLINGPVENTAACYYCIAGYYIYQADYNLAISNYLKAASVFKEFYTSYYYVETGLAGFYYSIWGNEEKATQYLKWAIAKLRPLSDSLAISFNLNALCKMAIKNKKYNEALHYAEESIKICKKEASDPTYGVAILQKGFVYLENKQPTLAYPFLHEAKSRSDSFHFQQTGTQGEFEIDFALYRYYQQMKNYSLSEQYLLDSYIKATNEKSHLLQLKYLKELSVFYEKQNPELALRYIKQYFHLNDTIQQAQNRFKVALYETEEKETKQNQKISALRQERAVQEATIGKRNMVLWISFSALVLICVSLIFLYRQFRINKETLLTLRKTQHQLILSEKIRSLRELTARIAHEIKNPLNFVNNFSEVNKELIAEMREEIAKGNYDEVNALAKDVEDNEEKINHHGKRADAIVKGMLQHSRSSSGVKEPADINALADEYLRLSYHGLRAKDKTFNTTIQTDFDQSLEKINIVPQDIGRVLLNIYNNAFYAVTEKKKQIGDVYEPTVKVTTSLIPPSGGGGAEIRVKDNGNGIPQKVLDRIFQPFFTTKPTGQGTGLGLSLSYDIIKAHGGEIKVETKEGEGAEFIIQLFLDKNN